MEGNKNTDASVRPWVVAVVDDHPVVRAGLAAVLTSDPAFAVGASCAHPSALTDTTGVDLVVCDLYLEENTPALREISELALHLPVLVVSASRRRGDVLAALRAGARGYVAKHAEPDQLLACAREAIHGGLALSSQVADYLSADLADAHLPSALRPAKALSPRELEVIDWIAQGFTHAQTARRMGVTTSTIDTYIQRIRGKIGAGNKAQLVAAAYELGRVGRGAP